MKTLIVYANPEPTSFSAALAGGSSLASSGGGKPLQS